MKFDALAFDNLRNNIVDEYDDNLIRVLIRDLYPAILKHINKGDSSLSDVVSDLLIENIYSDYTYIKEGVLKVLTENFSS